MDHLDTNGTLSDISSRSFNRKEVNTKSEQIKVNHTTTMATTVTTLYQIEEDFREEKKMLFQEHESVNSQYEKNSIDYIINRFDFEIFSKEEIQLYFTQVYVHNKSHKFYLGKSSTLGSLSVIILNDVSNKKSLLGSLLEKLAYMNEINSKYLLKLQGIVNNDDKQVYLIFDPVLTSYSDKIKTKPADLKLKYTMIFHLVELVHHCHSKSVGLETIRPSNLLLNGNDELRFLIPFRKLYYLTL